MNLKQIAESTFFSSIFTELLFQADIFW